MWLSDYNHEPKPLKNRMKIGIKRMWKYYRGWKWLTFIAMTFTLILTSYLVFIAKTTSVDTLQESMKTKTEIISATGDLAGTLHAQKGTYVNYDEISPEMKETVVATEDKRFYEHNGFDTIGMGRAFVRLLLNRDTSGGGGSTITQQLAKNAFLTLDQTFQRKLKEFFLALEIEKEYDKNQILEMYLNHAYFGNGVWGIEDAAMKYFGHSAESLDWNESIILTGILKGPSIYNPIDDYQAAIDRREVIANLLVKEGVLSFSDAEMIKQSEIYLHDNYYTEETNEYPYYFEGVIDEAIKVTRIPEDDLLSKGYKIYTYLNEGYQTVLEESYNNDWIFGSDHGKEPKVQSASVVIDPKTGGVAAVYGGRGEYVYRGFNRATDMRRSPGSTIKPLAVYVPALESGLTIQSKLPDLVKGYGSDNYTPKNYDLQTDPSGEVPMYYALAQSKNTSAVYLMDKLGIQRSVDKLAQFGIKIPSEDQSLTLALGALSRGVTLIELADAYSAFANHGVRNESAFISRIEDATGKVVYSNEKPDKHLVMTTKVAADMTSMMLETYGGYGTGFGAGPDYGQLAGKTGSTEVDEGNMSTRDKWMVGYTPDFVIVTWAGLDKEGRESLDELMPSGLSALFNIQTTNLMGASPQTPFDVVMASQMNGDTNVSEEIQWQDGASETLDQLYDIASQKAEELWDKAKEYGDVAWYKLQYLIEYGELP